MQCQSSDGYTCFCHYHTQEQMNIYNCSSNTDQTLPSSVQQFTDKLVVRKTNLTRLCNPLDYLDVIHFLDIRKNNISSICKPFADTLGNSTGSHFQQLWLSENPFHCYCSMTWMTEWLNNFTILGKHAVADYKDITCSSGEMKGRPIYILNPVEMGCFPFKWKPWHKVLVAIAAVSTVAIIIGLTFIIKYKRDVRFFLHHYCGCVCVCFGIPKDDQDEQLQRMSYDAFLVYR